MKESKSQGISDRLLSWKCYMLSSLVLHVILFYDIGELKLGPLVLIDMVMKVRAQARELDG